MNQFIREKPSFISKIDSKGRISIPISLRSKLKLLEGSEVVLSVSGSSISVVPLDGQDGVADCIGACGASGSGSSPGSGPLKKIRGDEK